MVSNEVWYCVQEMFLSWLLVERLICEKFGTAICSLVLAPDVPRV